MVNLLPAQLVLSASSLFVNAPSDSISSVSLERWKELHRQVGGRLYLGAPFASPCFANASLGVSDPACSVVQHGYVDELTRSNAFGAFINTQWETCQATGAQCLLDYTNPSNLEHVLQTKCELGSVSNYYIDVRDPEDVRAAFNFSKSTNATLVIKNTGHDYMGRSSAPNSISLWTHNLKNMSYIPTFVPEGCTDVSPAVTVGAGVQWGEAYAFAESQNITLVGGSDKSVGVSGGWLQGGGHSILSNTMGLGVDRVLQFKIVTPDGHYRTVNKCQHRDLFFALRGGGGGTFGVVLESTILASPQVTLQVVVVSFSLNPVLTERLWTILVDNGIKWANDGWGGLANSRTAIYITPTLSKDDAASSMTPLIQFGQELVDTQVEGAQLRVIAFPSFGTFFNFLVNSEVAAVGSSLALASRLIPRNLFANSISRSTLVSALTAANKMSPSLIILITPPSSFPGDGMTSVTDAWRTSIFHITVVNQWNWNATKADKKRQYTLASSAIDQLRKITPDAAYVNEADVYEPNHEMSFWGKHYARLLRIKRKYDPEHLLDCWHCVGSNPKSSRFACYL